MTAAYLNTTVTQEAIGAIEAQKAIAALQRNETTPDMAWLRLVELAGAGGWKSAVVRAFVIELAKRVSSSR